MLVPEVQEDAEETPMVARKMTDQDIPYDNTKNSSISALNQILSTKKLTNLIKKIPICITDRAMTEQAIPYTEQTIPYTDRTITYTDRTITECTMTEPNYRVGKKLIIINPAKFIGRRQNERVKPHLSPGKSPLVETFRNDFFSYLGKHRSNLKTDRFLSKKKESLKD